MNLLAHVPPLFEQPLRGDLHGRADGQIRVGDQLEPHQRALQHRAGAAERHPAKLQLRQASRLRQPAEADRQHVRLLDDVRAAPGAGSMG